MNMWTSLLCIYLCTGLTISSSVMCFTNLIQVDIDLGHQHNGHQHNEYQHNVRHNDSSANQSLKDKPSNCLRYDPSVLKTICHNTRHDQRYKILPFGAITRIRELEINNRLSHKKVQPRIRHTPAGINYKNLIQVEVTKDNGIIHDTQLRIGTINIRSIKRNDQVLLREINSNLDIIIATESWLKDTEADQWVQGCDFNRPPFQCHHANRHGRTGGGLMLICKSTMDVKEIQSQNTRSFEHASWSVSINNKSLTITSIYHPPAKDGITNAMFIDDVTEHLSKILINKQNNIILGDFNIHIDDPLDPEAGIFNDTMSALGLIQQGSPPIPKAIH